MTKVLFGIEVRHLQTSLYRLLYRSFHRVEPFVIPSVTLGDTLKPILYSKILSSSEDKSGSGNRYGKSITSLLTAAVCAFIAIPAAIGQTTAHLTPRRESFSKDRRKMVQRDDLILERPNYKATEAMPLGNGRLGAAVWAEDGLTAQLNRADTLPGRLSPGQIKVPGLARLTSAPDYKGQLNLYDGEFIESGAGMLATIYVEKSLDALVIDVSGADPRELQTASVELWQPRKPLPEAHGPIAMLSETWLDDKESGASNERFGSLAAVTANALDTRATVEGPERVKVTFHPRADGSFRIVVAAPSWRGGDTTTTSARLLKAISAIPVANHQDGWHRFWSHAAMFEMASADHSAEYFENLRALYLYDTAAESGDRFPGSQAGVGDLFSSVRDFHQWSPSAYWHWNLRMQVSANLGSGLDAFNAPFFRLYRENLSNILAWTNKHMPGRAGICQPETMRFNGPGYENESWLPHAPLNCAEDSPPYYNARTISTGAEVSLWILDQYEYTGDLNFLRANFPYLRESVRFLLDYGKTDSEGVLHTDPANAHEEQWDVRDPVTDISAMHSLFPRFVRAAKLLHTDAALAERVRSQALKLTALPLAASDHPETLLGLGAPRTNAIIATSYSPQARTHNSENLGLEPAWPYGLIDDQGPMHDTAVRTFKHRPYKNENDWSYDPIQAARLGLTEDFRSSLMAITERYQIYPSGFAVFPGGPEFYVEQIGVATAAMQMALADDYNGLIRIAPAWPTDWDIDGTVYLRHRHKVTLRIRNHKIMHLELAAGSSGKVSMRNPWPGEKVRVISSANLRQPFVTSDPVVTFNVHEGVRYQIQASTSKDSKDFREDLATPPSSPKKLGSRSLGLFK